MYLVKRSSGFYHVRFRDDEGKWKCVSTRTNKLPEANRFFSDLKSCIKKSKPEVLLSQFREQYQVYSRTNHTAETTIRIGYVLDRFGAFVGDVALTSIGPRQLEQYKACRLQHVSPITVNIELRTLKAFFGVAVHWDLIEMNPFTKIKLVRIPETDPAYFSPEELMKVYRKANLEWLRALILLAVNTGLRRGELINLRWSDVDLERRILIVRNRADFQTKSKRQRIVPLNPAVTGLLGSLERTSEHVLVNSEGRKLNAGHVTQSFKNLVRAAGIERRLHFHSLRHSFASFLVQNSVPIYEVQRLLGHSNIAVTQIYSHLLPETLHSTVNKIALNLN